MSSIMKIQNIISASPIEGTYTNDGLPAVWGAILESTAPMLYSADPESGDNIILLTAGFETAPTALAIQARNPQQLPQDANLSALAPAPRRQWIQTILQDDAPAASNPPQLLKQEDQVTSPTFGTQYHDLPTFGKQESTSTTPATQQRTLSPVAPLQLSTPPVTSRPLTEKRQASEQENTATQQPNTVPKQECHVATGNKRKLDDISDDEEEEGEHQHSVSMRGGGEDPQPGYIIDAVTGRERKRRMMDDFPRGVGMRYEEERRRERVLQKERARWGARTGYVIDAVTGRERKRRMMDDFPRGFGILYEEERRRERFLEKERQRGGESQDGSEEGDPEEDESEDEPEEGEFEEERTPPPPSHYHCELTGNLRKRMLIESSWGPERRKEWLRNRFYKIMAKPVEERAGQWFESGDSELEFSEWEEEKKLRIQRKKKSRKPGRRRGVKVL